MWLAIYIAAQIIRYVVAPLVLLFYIHVIFRAWNYLAVETPHEWLYIRHFSKGSPKYEKTYLRLCDRVKRNRTKITYAKFPGMVRRSKKFTQRLMIVCGVMAVLWLGSFGLYNEYTVPAVALQPAEQQAESYQQTQLPPPELPTLPPPALGEDTPAGIQGIDHDHWLNPANWPEQGEMVLTLTEQGELGTFLRNGPGISGHSVIEILWDNDRLVFLEYFVPDPDVFGLFWLHVLSPSGTEGYVSSHMVELE